MSADYRLRGAAILVAALAASMTMDQLAAPLIGIANAEDLPFLFSFEVAGSSFPDDIEVDSSNTIYVLYDAMGGVQKYTGHGTLITTWSVSFERPDSFAIDASDNVYVSERPASRVLKFDSDGNLIGWLGKCTGGVNCDTDNQRSKGFSCTDTTCTGLGAGSGDGQFNHTRGIGMGPSGDIYVADQFNNRIQVFDSDGNFLFKFGEFGTGDGQIISAMTVEVDSFGDIYVTHLDESFIISPRVVKYTSDGEFIGWLGKCTDGINCDTEHQRSEGFSCTEATCSGFGPGSADGQLDFFSSPKILIDSSDNLYIPEWGNARVQKFTSDGAFIGWAGMCTGGTNCDTENQRSIGFSCSQATCEGSGLGFGEGQFLSPQAVAINSIGNIYVLDARDQLDERHPSGGEDAPNIVHVYGIAAPADLTILSVDLADNPINGIWTTIRSMDGTFLKSGFTPLTFEGYSGLSYKVTVSNYDGKAFSKWQDDESTSKSRTVNLSSDTTLTAIYDTGDTLRGFTPLTYMTSQPNLTVNATTLDSSRVLHMWTIIDPQSIDGSETTYRVYASNYKDRIFDHWEDGSTNRVRTLTITEETTITAYYQVAPPVTTQSVSFTQKTVLEVPEVDVSLTGVDAQFTCPGGAGGSSGDLFGFFATSGESGITGGWGTIGAPGAGGGDGGQITSLVVNSTNFKVEGNWKPEFAVQNTGVVCSAPIPSTVTIEGPCGNDVIVTFSAANGVTGTFRGDVTCTV